MSHSAFISYSHVDKPVAQAIATALSERGLTVWIDEGELRAGDSIIERISTAIAEIDYVVAIVSDAAVSSSWCQKELALAVTGGLAREHVKVLPLRLGEVAMPASLADVFYRQVDPENPADVADLLASDIRSHREDPTPDDAARRKGTGTAFTATETSESALSGSVEPTGFVDIKLTGIVREGIGRPRNDGTRGSALYAVPFRLSRRPPADWSDHLVATWNSPPQWTSMHRPGICRVSGDVVTLDGVTIEEVERYHLETLKLCVARVNQDYATHVEKQNAAKRREHDEEARRANQISATLDRLNFD
jgi:hypothetical protein